MTRIAIFAPTGMLGSMVYNVLKEKYSLVLVYRNQAKLQLLEKTYGPLAKHKLVKFDLDEIYQDYLTGFAKEHISPKAQALFELIGEVDAVINCAGIIKQRVLTNPDKMLFLNGGWPHILSRQYGNKLIHITTDCVYSGVAEAPYDEKSQKSPNDLYGLSKSLGEPYENSLVLRTSIIGPELGEEGVSLLGWFRKQEGQTIKGFTTHLWNGVTTKEFAKVCDKIISHREGYPQNGLYHIFGSDVNKYEMLQVFKKKFGTNVTIEEALPPGVDRRLRTVFEVCKKLEIPSFEKMVKEL